MRYLVFDTQAEAAAAVATIDERARQVFSSQGYTVRPDGAVLGKAGGRDDPDAPTLTWDVPRERADGRWVIAHPEAHPSALFVVAPGVTLAAHLTHGIVAPVEVETGDWWPSSGDA